MTPFPFPLSWSVGLVLILAWGGTGYWAGDHNRNNAWLAKQAVAERQARLALETEVKRGQVAASQSIAEQRAMQDSYQTLEGKFNELRIRGPLVVFRDKAAAPAPQSGTAAPGTAPGTAADPAVGLSLGAVWMWNSALTGTDIPAGACGAADPTAPACAADSGLGLEAAWANHAANAKSYALDRLQHQRLIDYIAAQGTP
jgi:hypothetical protein